MHLHTPRKRPATTVYTKDIIIDTLSDEPCFFIATPTNTVDAKFYPPRLPTIGLLLISCS